MIRTLFLILWSVCMALPAWAVIDSYEFDNDAQRKRYQSFIDELRCPKCQNQNLAGSDAPIAADLRRELHRLLLEGRSDSEIVDFMVSRYGDFVLYRPPVNAQTVALWVAPLVFLLLGLVFVARLVRRRRRTTDTNDAVPELSAQEKARLDSLLAEDRD